MSNGDEFMDAFTDMLRRHPFITVISFLCFLVSWYAFFVNVVDGDFETIAMLLCSLLWTGIPCFVVYLEAKQRRDSHALTYTFTAIPLAFLFSFVVGSLMQLAVGYQTLYDMSAGFIVSVSFIAMMQATFPCIVAYALGCAASYD